MTRFASLALCLLLPAFASLQAEEPTQPPKDATQRIYSSGGLFKANSRVEWTETGAVVHLTAQIHLKSRPMSEKEEALRIEWINTVPLGDDEEEKNPERREKIGEILNRTNPINVLDGVQGSLQEAFDSWKSDMRFEAIWMDQKYPKDAE